MKKFLKAEYKSFEGQIDNFYFFLGVIISIAITLLSFAYLFGDSEKDMEMRKPSCEFKEKSHKIKQSTIFIHKTL